MTTRKHTNIPTLSEADRALGDEIIENIINRSRGNPYAVRPIVTMLNQETRIVVLYMIPGKLRELKSSARNTLTTHAEDQARADRISSLCDIGHCITLQDQDHKLHSLSVETLNAGLELLEQTKFEVIEHTTYDADSENYATENSSVTRLLYHYSWDLLNQVKKQFTLDEFKDTSLNILKAINATNSQFEKMVYNSKCLTSEAKQNFETEEFSITEEIADMMDDLTRDSHMMDKYQADPSPDLRISEQAELASSYYLKHYDDPEEVVFFNDLIYHKKPGTFSL